MGKSYKSVLPHYLCGHPHFNSKSFVTESKSLTKLQDWNCSRWKSSPHQCKRSQNLINVEGKCLLTRTLWTEKKSTSFYLESRSLRGHFKSCYWAACPSLFHLSTCRQLMLNERLWTRDPQMKARSKRFPLFKMCFGLRHSETDPVVWGMCLLTANEREWERERQGGTDKGRWGPWHTSPSHSPFTCGQTHTYKRTLYSTQPCHYLVFFQVWCT